MINLNMEALLFLEFGSLVILSWQSSILFRKREGNLCYFCVSSLVWQSFNILNESSDTSIFSRKDKIEV